MAREEDIVYDPMVGTFLSEDPEGFAAGDPNFYRYVGNHPTYASDPDGRAEKPLRKKYAEFLDFLEGAQSQGQRLTLDTKVKVKAYGDIPIDSLLNAHCLDVVEGCDTSDSGAYAARQFQRIHSARSRDRALSTDDVALLVDLIRGTPRGGEALGAPYDANGKRILPEFSTERGFGFTPDGTYVYYRPGIGWVSPCVVCHGRNADGPLPGLTPTDSFVGGRWYHSGDNLNILRNYSAGVSSTIVNAVPNLINLGVYAKRVLTSSADEFDFSPFIDTAALGEKVEDFVYPNRDRGSLVTTAGQVAGEVPAFFATGGLFRAGEGVLSKGANLLRAGRASGGAGKATSLGTSSIQAAGPGAEFQFVVSGPSPVFQATAAPSKGGIYRISTKNIVDEVDAYAARHVGELIARDPVAYRSYLQLRDRTSTNIILDYGPPPMPNVTGRIRHWGEFEVFVRNTQNAREAVATIVHESRHISDIQRGLMNPLRPTQLDEYRAFRREFLYTRHYRK